MQAKVAQLEEQVSPAKNESENWSGKLLARIRELEEQLAYSMPQLEVQQLLEQTRKPFLEVQAENATLKANANGNGSGKALTAVSREALLEASIAKKDAALASMTSKLMEKVKEMEALQMKQEM